MKIVLLPALFLSTLCFVTCKKDNNQGSRSSIQAIIFCDTSQCQCGTATFTTNNDNNREHWDFGDGNTLDIPSGSLGKSVHHTYQNSGLFTVVLTLNSDSSHAARKQIKIKPCITLVTDGSGVAGDSIHFSFNHDGNYSGMPTWSFGDGTSSTDSSAYHVFLSGGYYRYGLTYFSNSTFYYSALLYIYPDPGYTRTIAKKRRMYGSLSNFTGDCTGYTYPTDSTYTINYINKIDISFFGAMMRYKPQGSTHDRQIYEYIDHDPPYEFHTLYYYPANDSVTFSVFVQGFSHYPYQGCSYEIDLHTY